MADGRIAWAALEADNRIDMKLGALQPGRQAITRVTGDPAALSGPLFAPREVQVTGAVHRDPHR